MSDHYLNLNNTDSTRTLKGQVKGSNPFCGANSDSLRNINGASAAPLDLSVHRVIPNSFPNNTFDNNISQLASRANRFSGLRAQNSVKHRKELDDRKSHPSPCFLFTSSPCKDFKRSSERFEFDDRRWTINRR